MFGESFGIAEEIITQCSSDVFSYIPVLACVASLSIQLLVRQFHKQKHLFKNNFNYHIINNNFLA